MNSVVEYFQVVCRFSETHPPRLAQPEETKRLGRQYQPGRSVNSPAARTRSRSRDYTQQEHPESEAQLVYRAEEQCPHLQMWMEESLGVSDQHISTFQTLSQNTEKWICYLTVYGKALFQMFEDEIRMRWTRYEDSTIENLDWRECVQAILSLAHAHLLKALITLSNKALLLLLWTKSAYWSAFCSQALSTILELPSDTSVPLKAFLLEILYDAATEVDADTAYFTLISLLMSKPYRLEISKVHSTTLSCFRRIMANRDLKKKYRSLVYENDIAAFEERYQAAVDAFISGVHMGQIHAAAGVYGLTLPNRSVIVDMIPEVNATLCQAYQVIVMLHEFAHFMTRCKCRCVGEYRRIATPPGIGRVLSTQATNKDPLLMRIDTLFYCPPSGEAGAFLETAVFGSQLDTLNLKAAKILLTLQPSDSLAKFKLRFIEANKRSQSAENPSVGMKHRKCAGTKESITIGRCGKAIRTL